MHVWHLLYQLLRPSQEMICVVIHGGKENYVSRTEEISSSDIVYK